MVKTLYLMRHGQTVFNLKGKIQGASDSPLTALGVQQANAAQQYFKTKTFILTIFIHHHNKEHVTR